MTRLVHFIATWLLLGLAFGSARAGVVPPPSPELLVAEERAEPAKGLHPVVILRDRAGQAVVISGGPLNFRRSCGDCHDANYIGEHGYHFRVGVDELSRRGTAASARAWDFGPGLFGRWDPLAGYDSVFVGDPASKLAERPSLIDRWVNENRARLAGGGPAMLGSEARDYEPNCALCHVRGAAASRDPSLPLALAQSASLVPLGIVELTAAAGDAEALRVVWDKERFSVDGSVAPQYWTIQRPSSAACATCHGIAAAKDLKLADFGAQARNTETTGQVFSSARLSDSSLNLAQRESLDRPWDVHAERLLTCADCHFSLNDPRAAFRSRETQPEHLKREVRHLSLGEFLRHPSHELAKGESSQGTVANAYDGTMRRCEDCHDAPKVHRFLPKTERHLEQLACESCHASKVHGPARQVTDYTVIDAKGRPRVEYRGVEQPLIDAAAYVSGYQPLLLRRKDVGGRIQLVPYNIVTSFFWVVDEVAGPRPASLALLEQALYANAESQTRLIELLDRDRNGELEDEERSLESAAAVNAVRGMLLSAGARNPRIVGELQPYGIHHGMAPARFALRDCNACHSRSSRITTPFELARHSPHGVVPSLMADSAVMEAFRLERDTEARLVLVPELSELGLHVFGLNRSRWLDAFGLTAFGLVFAGAVGHGALRFHSSRRRPGRRR